MVLLNWNDFTYFLQQIIDPWTFQTRISPQASQLTQMAHIFPFQRMASVYLPCWRQPLSLPNQNLANGHNLEDGLPVSKKDHHHLFQPFSWPFGRGPTTLSLGELRSPWLLTTYKSWEPILQEGLLHTNGWKFPPLRFLCLPNPTSGLHPNQ